MFGRIARCVWLGLAARRARTAGVVARQSRWICVRRLLRAAFVSAAGFTAPSSEVMLMRAHLVAASRAPRIAVAASAAQSRIEAAASRKRAPRVVSRCCAVIFLPTNDAAVYREPISGPKSQQLLAARSPFRTSHTAPKSTGEFEVSPGWSDAGDRGRHRGAVSG